MKKIGVIGAGIFGTTIAIFLARAGYHVTLFERKQSILSCASWINQYRLHRGYHYPRSGDTITSCKMESPRFAEEYPEAIINDNQHYYCIAKEGSFVSSDQFKKVCDEYGLEYSQVDPHFINLEQVDGCYRVQESSIDPHALKIAVQKKLQTHGVDVRLGVNADLSIRNDFDVVVVATYAALNELLEQHGSVAGDYQFELVEKIVISAPEELRKKSVVIMDGPFMCFDPLGQTDNFLMGHVEYAIHQRSVGKKPEIPHAYIPLLNSGVIQKPPVSNAHLFLTDGSRFIPELKKAKHLGSMFTIRTVLPRIDATDARPTIVREVDKNLISVYSGKIGNSIEAARLVTQMVESSS